ncbi:MAG TPA: hypothetical protein VNW29_03415 [Candidatus Sulfotelmatobacter sp.]|jgi:hypothetical protein|nr:hypothetical protein [Candidatus Sulfotelmatobacter sp.]
MYYSYPCPYCSKIFYSFNDNKEAAAQTLFNGIKQHLNSYGEDDKEHQFDKDSSIEINQMYAEMSASTEAPAGGYSLD